jgi:hypothetical protein
VFAQVEVWRNGVNRFSGEDALNSHSTPVLIDSGGVKLELLKYPKKPLKVFHVLTATRNISCLC